MKTKLLFFILVICGSLPLVAQENKDDSDAKDLVTRVDEMPKFPGGEEEMLKYLKTNVKYPTKALEMGLSGKVLIRFVVQKDGSLDEFTVVRGVDPLLDEEALRVVKAMPKWTPGMLDGKPVRVQFTIPIIFSMKNSSNQPVMPRGIIIPKGDIVRNKTFEGVWQSCVVSDAELEYRVLPLPIMKMITGKTFMNVLMGDRQTGVAAILTKGKFKKDSETTFTETLVETTLQDISGFKNKITCEFLNDNLMKCTYKLPAASQAATEYWLRVNMLDNK